MFAPTALLGFFTLINAIYCDNYTSTRKIAVRESQ